MAGYAGVRVLCLAWWLAVRVDDRVVRARRPLVSYGTYGTRLTAARRSTFGSVLYVHGVQRPVLLEEGSPNGPFSARSAFAVDTVGVHGVYVLVSLLIDGNVRALCATGSFYSSAPRGRGGLARGRRVRGGSTHLS